MDWGFSWALPVAKGLLGYVETATLWVTEAASGMWEGLEYMEHERLREVGYLA